MILCYNKVSCREIMLENCRWFLYISRLCGCHPHTINKQSMVKNFPLLLVYSLIMLVMHCFGVYYSMGFFTACAKINVGCVLQRVNRYNRSFCMFSTIILSCLRHGKFEHSLMATLKFDELIKHHRWNIADNNKNKWRTDCIQWLIILLISSAWFLRVVLATFILKERGTKDQAAILIPFAIQILTRLMFCLEIVKFCLLYDALRRRFHHLNKLCHGLIGLTIGIDININFYANRLTIGNFQKLYHYLYDATEYLTSYYSPLLFYWIMSILLDTVTYTFTVLFGNIQFSGVLLVCDECITIIYLILQIVAISRICDLTCNEANSLISTILSPATSVIKNNDFTIETIELAVRLRLYPVRVKVCSLFDVNSRFTFSVFGILVMYVVLIYSCTEH